MRPLLDFAAAAYLLGVAAFALGASMGADNAASALLAALAWFAALSGALCAWRFFRSLPFRNADRQES
jgi:hypothetical protein